LNYILEYYYDARTHDTLDLAILLRKLHLIFTANERNGGVTNTTKCAPHELEVQVTTEKPTTRKLRVRRKFPRLRDNQTANRGFEISAGFLFACNFPNCSMWFHVPAAFIARKRTSPWDRKRMRRTIAISTAVVVIPVFNVQAQLAVI